MTTTQRLTDAAAQGSTVGALLAAIVLHNAMATAALITLAFAWSAVKILWEWNLELEAANDHLEADIARLDLAIRDLQDEQ